MVEAIASPGRKDFEAKKSVLLLEPRTLRPMGKQLLRHVEAVRSNIPGHCFEGLERFLGGRSNCFEGARMLRGGVEVEGFEGIIASKQRFLLLLRPGCAFVISSGQINRVYMALKPATGALVEKAA